MCIMLCTYSTRAFDFDGIDLNQRYITVAQEISKRGYSYDSERNCLKGICQGTEIYISINYIDVSKRGMVGQLIVEIPIANASTSFVGITTLLNVIYHQVTKDTKSVTYAADKDGTQLVVSQKGESVFLTYNTPYYKVK